MKKTKKVKLMLIMLLASIMLFASMMVSAEEKCPCGGSHIASQEKYAYTRTAYPGTPHPVAGWKYTPEEGIVPATLSCATMVFIDVKYRDCRKCGTRLTTYEVPRIECACN